MVSYTGAGCSVFREKGMMTTGKTLTSTVDACGSVGLWNDDVDDGGWSGRGPDIPPRHSASEIPIGCHYLNIITVKNLFLILTVEIISTFHVYVARGILREGGGGVQGGMFYIRTAWNHPWNEWTHASRAGNFPTEFVAAGAIGRWYHLRWGESQPRGNTTVTHCVEYSSSAVNGYLLYDIQ